MPQHEVRFRGQVGVGEDDNKFYYTLSTWSLDGQIKHSERTYGPFDTEQESKDAISNALKETLKNFGTMEITDMKADGAIRSVEELGKPMGSQE